MQRREQGIVDENNAIITTPPPARQTLSDVAAAEDVLRHGSITQLRKFPTEILVALSTGIQPSTSTVLPKTKAQAVEQLAAYVSSRSLICDVVYRPTDVTALVAHRERHR